MYEDFFIITLFYDVESNRFIDEFGCVIHDIHRIITPNQIMTFKNKCDYCIVPDVTNTFMVEMIYPDEFVLQ